MSSTQLFLSIIVLFIIYKTVASYKKDHLSLIFIGPWLFIWIVGLVVILQPSILVFLAQAIGIGRGVDLAIYLSILAIFYGLYKILVRLERMQKQITQLTRSQAIFSAKKKKSY